MNRSHNSSVLFLRDLSLPLIDPMQINLIEAEIAGCGRIVSVPIRCEIEVGFARHDNMHSAAMHVCNGKPVRRFQAGLGREERPDANTRVCHSSLGHPRLGGGKQCKQQ